MSDAKPAVIELLNQQTIRDQVDRCFDNYKLEGISAQRLSDTRERLKDYLVQLDPQLVTNEKIEELLLTIKSILESSNFDPTKPQEIIQRLRIFLDPFVPYTPLISSIEQIDYLIATSIKYIFIDQDSCT